VVQVSMGQKNSVDTACRHGKSVPVSLTQLSFLVQTAIDKDLPPVNLDKIPRAGNIFRRPKKTQSDLHT